MSESSQLHIALFPWLAFGHIIPFLELAKQIAQTGQRIFFVSTTRNINRLPKIPSNLSPLINFVSLTLPSDDNLPKDAEATSDLPLHKVSNLKLAFDKRQDSLAEFLKTSSPDWIIYDFASYWLPTIATKHGISCAFFSILQAQSICFFGSSFSAMINGEDPRTELEHFTVKPPWVPFHSNVAFRLHEARKFFNHIELDAPTVRDMFRVGSGIAGCKVIAIRSCMELEYESLNLLGELHGKTVVPVGLLPPSTLGNENDTTWLTICGWLDKQKMASVVYVAFGSELNFSQDELTELALGLELSGLSFFWVLRIVDISLELPNDFEDRVKDRGIVWRSWAPQMRILAHESVGAFLTHTGYSSVIESLHFGCPLIMLPFYIDQGLIARVYTEKRVGTEILRNEQDGTYTRNSVAKSMRLVIVEEKGRIYRDKAKEMKALFADKDLHHQYINKFVEFLQNHRKSFDP